MINLELALRAGEAKRWTIVNLTRPQSVAEHLHRVYFIAMGLSEALGVEHHNTFDASAIGRHALTHDLHEVISGDPPSNLKRAAPDAFKRIEEMARQQMGLDSSDSHRGTVVESVVKLADVIEALLFAYQNGGRDRPLVWQDLLGNAAATMRKCRSAHPHLNWDRTSEVIFSCAASDGAWEQVLTEWS